MDKKAENLGGIVNQIFDQVIHIYHTINAWVENMLVSTETYDLKRYIIDNIKDRYSSIFWALLDLRTELSITQAIPGILPPLMDDYSTYNKIVWGTNKNKDPFWEVLGMGTSEEFGNKKKKLNYLKNPEPLLNVLKANGNSSFYFLGVCTEMAHNEFGSIEKIKFAFPDTLLLRTFIKLLENSTSELNGLTTRHLDFYYSDILKQINKPAEPDHVFACVKLSSNKTIYPLSNETSFKAGLDPDKNPILFKSLKNQSLNPALIDGIYTLYVDSTIKVDKTVRTTISNLYLNEVVKPGIVKRDGKGKVVGWSTFGEKPAGIDTINTKTNLGLAFGSPMLFLKEGVRQITITLNFTKSVPKVLFTNASFYLSTSKAWMQVMYTTGSDIKTSESIKLVFKLSATDSSIEPFKIKPSAKNPNGDNPDGYKSEWPLFKIVFSESINLKTPPVISSLTVDTQVTGLKTFVLSNDNGVINAAKPFQPFGPAAIKDSSFYIGNAEMFSKPLDSFQLEMDWSGLPQSLNDYYDTYNKYLNKELEPVVIPKTSLLKKVTKTLASVVKNQTTIINTLKGIVKTGKTVLKGIKKIGAWFKGLFTKSVGPVMTDGTSMLGENSENQGDGSPEPKLANYTFKVNFGILYDHEWGVLSGVKKKKCVTDIVPNKCNDASLEAMVEGISLFNFEADSKSKDGKTFSPTCYEYVKETNPEKTLPYDPNLQLADLKLTEKSSAGFMKMSLSNPQYGFGSVVYPNVVSAVALLNADELMRVAVAGGKPNLIPTPNVPFIPVLGKFKGDYNASTTYNFNYGLLTKFKPQNDLKNGIEKIEEVKSDNVPLQCYHYSVFKNYCVYDNEKESDCYADSIGLQHVGINRCYLGVALYPPLKYDAVQFIRLKQIITPHPISFFFELSESAFRGQNDGFELCYYYMSTAGWETLDVLSDSTNGMTCSGIITFDFKDDIKSSGFIQMPDSLDKNDKIFWIAVGLTGKPEAVAKTVFQDTNGVELARTGTAYLTDTEKPTIAPNQIKGPEKAIPQIASVVQPFVSFGGKSAENKAVKNKRVSNRLKTKDRVVTKGDYHRVIQQNFDTVFYSKVNFNKNTRMIDIYLVKKVEDQNSANAFLPLVSKCLEEGVTANLKSKTGYDQLTVNNFDLSYVTVSATVFVHSGFGIKETAIRITQALKVFLSPWIKSDGEQITIDQGISDVQVANFLNDFNEVVSVEDIGFKLSSKDLDKKEDDHVPKEVDTIPPSALPSILYVADVSQNINCKHAI